MSVFSMIKRGRQAAKEHRAEQAKKEKEEAAKPPYKHIPKHAAIDAMSGGPAGWREADRVRIVEQNRRRSAMTASGVGMSGFITPVPAGVPRVHSSLSHVSYPSAYASPVVRLPRGYSYSSMPAGWTPHGREVSYSPIDAGSISVKGKEVERLVDSSRTSRSSSKVSTGRIPLPPSGTLGIRDITPSPVESSGDSTSSRDELEMKPVVRQSVSIPPSARTPATVSRPARPTSDTEFVHRLHPGRSRRVSDPNQSPPQNSLAPRTSSLAPGIPPVPALPPIEFGTAITTPDDFPSAASSDSSIAVDPLVSNTSSSSGTSAVPVTFNVNEEQASQQAEIGVARLPSQEVAVAMKKPVEVAASKSPTKGGRRTSKVTRFTELEPIKSNETVTVTVEPIQSPSPEERQEQGRMTVDLTTLPTTFDVSALSQQPKMTAPSPTSRPASKPGKLSKTAAGNGKLVKKSRWSQRGSKSTAVAG